MIELGCLVFRALVPETPNTFGPGRNGDGVLFILWTSEKTAVTF